MATTKPRITITLEPDQHDVLRRLADLQRTSMSKIVTEFLGEVRPILANVANALEAVQRASSDARAKFVRTAEVAEEELRPLAEFARNQFDMFAAEIGRIEQEATPHTAAEEATGARGARATRAHGASDASEGKGPRPVITGATEVQRRTRAGRGEGSGAASKPSSGKGSRVAKHAKVLADADNDGKGARVLVGGASRRAK